MTMHHLVAELVFVHTASDEQFEAFLDSVMDELDKIGHGDADLTASLTARRAEFLIGLEEDDFEDAAIRLLSDLRTALHAAQCRTPDWPIFRRQSGTVRSVEVPLVTA